MREATPAELEAALVEFFGPSGKYPHELVSDAPDDLFECRDEATALLSIVACSPIAKERDDAIAKLKAHRSTPGAPPYRTSLRKELTRVAHLELPADAWPSFWGCTLPLLLKYFPAHLAQKGLKTPSLFIRSALQKLVDHPESGVEKVVIGGIEVYRTASGVACRTAKSARWNPPKGYVSVKGIMHHERFRRNGKNPPRETIRDWEKRAEREGNPVARVQDRATQEVHYPERWVLEQIDRWTPRQ